MAGMKRFVTYIYSYEDGKKGNNVGFAKIEIRGEECRIEIHLREVYIGAAGCKVYLFRGQNGEMEGVLLGELKLARGMGDFGIRVKEVRIGKSPYGVSQMDGIFLLGEDGSIFMSRWTEGAPLTVTRDHFREWEPKEREPEGAQSEVQQSEASQQMAEVKQPEVKAEQPEGAQPEVKARQPEGAQSEVKAEQPEGAQPEAKAEQPEDARSETKSPIVATELASMKIPARNLFPNYHWPEIWDRMRKKHETGTPFINKKIECMQLELKELRELPRRYWYLGNNSFLLHGYFNYQYLVLGKIEESETRWLLGIPGIYQRQERVMAAIFGFPEFFAAGSGDEEIDKNAEPINRFGCWFRYIEE